MYYFYFFQDLLSHLMLKLCFLASEFVLVTIFLVEAQVPCKKGLNIAQSTLLFSGCLLEVAENSDSVALIIKINFTTTNLTLIYRYSDNCNHMDSIWCRVLIYHNSPDWTTDSEPAPPDEIPKAAVPMLIPIIVSLLLLLAIIFGFLYCYSNKMYIFKDELSTSYITTESTSTRDKMNPIVL
uniref:Uncharacterized protein n=1 Tax=Biomphalaria glabrata TaxID=6526 RepID=A0A2C9L9I4_BIOGL